MLRIRTSVLACAVVASSLAGQVPAAQRVHVAVATIKPTPLETSDELFTVRGHHVVTVGTSVVELVKFVYGLHPSQIAGVQPWMTKERFDVDAVVETSHDLNNDDMRDVVREVLADRFHLRYRMETASLPVFLLLRSGNDLRMKMTERLPGTPVDFYGSHGELHVNNATMQDVATGFSRGLVARPVVDQTGLQGRYDFTLHWTQDGVNASDPASPPDLFAVLPDQAGLKLKSETATIPVLRIERAESPSPN